MKMKRKIFALTVLAAVVVSLAACGPAPTPPPAEEPTEAAPPPSEVTLVFSDWHLTEPHWETSLKDAFETFEAEHGA